MYNSCLLCLRSYHNNLGISLHRFPKDPSVRIQWLNACGFTENDIKCRRQICSMHFEQSCYTTGHKKVLKRGSIPTKFIEKSLMSVSSIQTINDLSIQTEPCEQSVIVTPERKYCSLDMDLDQNRIMSMPSTSASVQTTMQTEQLISETPKHKRKRKCFVGDIKTSDLSTPKKSKLKFKKAKFQILAQQRKIKNLNQTIRRLRNKLSSLESLFKHLKDNNLITEYAHDEILTQGRNSKLAVIGFGTYTICDKKIILNVLDVTLGACYRLTDSAAMYKNEAYSNEAFQVLLPKYHLKREDLYITSKLELPKTMEDE